MKLRARAQQVANKDITVIVINVLLMLAAVGDLLMQQPILPKEYLPYVALAIGIINIVVKYLSNPVQQ